MALHLFLFISVIAGISGLYQERPRLGVEQGVLEGKICHLPGGRRYYAFKGIPYAKPPLGILRFRAPQPPEPWDGVLNAHNYGSFCPQLDFFNRTLKPGNEDCLFLNVFTPVVYDSSEDRSLPVMFWIHGGGFTSGSGNDGLFGPEPLMFQDVVLVTFNYRLGPSGFLCMDTPEVPGNAGLKDQTAALRWVKKNIAHFNGDPDNVTIFGQSAGGLSVSLHLLSPLSRGLFHRAVMQSGTFANDWGFSEDDRGRAFQLGRKLGLVTSDERELLEFLTFVPSELLPDISVQMIVREKYLRFREYSFVPVVEKFLTNEAFMTEDPFDLLQNGNMTRVPVMLGYTSADGLIFLIDKNTIADRTKYQELALSRRLAWNIPMRLTYDLGRRINEFYFGGPLVQHVEDLVHLESDSYLTYDVFWVAKAIARNYDVPLYFYKFDCRSDRNIIDKVAKLPKVNGVCHCDDVSYLFQSKHHKPIDINSFSFKLVNRTTALWTNFAATGNPTPDDTLGNVWPQFTVEDQYYMNMQNDLNVAQYPDQVRFAFWENIEDEIKPYHTDRRL